MKTTSLVVGVSEYFIENVNNLPFCKNDVTAMVKSLESGLALKKKDIVECGAQGQVTEEGFNSALKKITSITTEDDTLIFYFSGHGYNHENQHYLVLSDTFINTNDLIRDLEKIPAKSKVIFLDCCFSGNYSIEENVNMDIDQMIADFHGKGYAVFSSSNAEQVSYGHPEKPISIFTSFLCDAFQNKILINEGKITLNDIHKLVRLYLEVWNKRNPQMQQNPIFKRNMGGTIFFEVNDYKPYPKTKIYLDTDKFIIYEVEPAHNIIKRYAVKVILKKPFSLEEISKISNEIINNVKNTEVYNNAKSLERFKGKPANVIWIYYGFDESDMLRSNYICHITWCDNEQDTTKWYKVNGLNKFMVDGIHFDLHKYYESLKKFNQSNIGSEDEIRVAVKEISKTMISSTEKVISKYNEFLNDLISESTLIKDIKPFLNQIEEAYHAYNDMELGPDDMYEWRESYTSLFSTIHDLIYFYNEKYLEQRTFENRKIIMEMTLKSYYKELETIKSIES